MKNRVTGRFVFAGKPGSGEKPEFGHQHRDYRHNAACYLFVFILILLLFPTFYCLLDFFLFSSHCLQINYQRKSSNSAAQKPSPASRFPYIIYIRVYLCPSVCALCFISLAPFPLRVSFLLLVPVAMFWNISRARASRQTVRRSPRDDATAVDPLGCSFIPRYRTEDPDELSSPMSDSHQRESCRRSVTRLSATLAGSIYQTYNNCTHVYLYGSIYPYIYININTNTHLYIYIYIFMFIYIYKYTEMNIRLLYYISSISPFSLVYYSVSR